MVGALGAEAHPGQNDRAGLVPRQTAQALCSQGGRVAAARDEALGRDISRH